MSNGITALHEAARAGHEHVANKLLQAGVPADSTTDTGLTTLLLAAAQGHVNLIRLLLGIHPTVQLRDATAPSDWRQTVAEQNDREQPWLKWRY